jgi:predicted ATPase
MRRYIVTGAPGAGKTVLIRRLERAGFAVVEEAATDVNALMIGQGVAEPHRASAFLGDILALQLSRQARADAWGDAVALFDRSPICTLALAEFIGVAPPPALVREVERIGRERVYEPEVFFIETLGFVTPTPIRRISYEDTLRFEAVHADVYRRCGFELIPVPKADVEARAKLVLEKLGRPA